MWSAHAHSTSAAVSAFVSGPSAWRWVAVAMALFLFVRRRRLIGGLLVYWPILVTVQVLLQHARWAAMDALYGRAAALAADPERLKNTYSLREDVAISLMRTVTREAESLAELQSLLHCTTRMIYLLWRMPVTPVRTPDFEALWFGYGDDASFARDRSDGTAAVVMIVHGGGFSLGDPAMAAPSLLAIWEHCQRAPGLSGARLLAVDYTLAPHARYPAQLLQCAAAYDYLTGPVGAGGCGLSPQRVVVVGDSAGGNLSAALMLYLRDRLLTATTGSDEQSRAGIPVHVAAPNSRRTGDFKAAEDDSPPLVGPPTGAAALPAGLVLLSPWLDLSCGHASRSANGSTDFVVQSRMLELVGMYLPPGAVLADGAGVAAGGTNVPSTDASASPASPSGGEAVRVTDPLVSPIFGELHSLPPVLTVVGGKEILYDEVKAFGVKARAAGVAVSEVCHIGMPHVYPYLELFVGAPAQRALREISEWIVDTLHAATANAATAATQRTVGGHVSGSAAQWAANAAARQAVSPRPIKA